MGLKELFGKIVNAEAGSGLQKTSRLFDLVKKNSNSPFLYGGVTKNVMFDDRGISKEEIFQRDLYTGNFAKKNFPIAHTNLVNSLGGLNKVQPDTGAVVFKNRNDLQNITRDGTGINNLMDNLRIPQNSRGVYYSPNSYLARKVQHSPAMQWNLFKNYNNYLNNNPDSNSINFTPLMNIDAFAGIQHATLYKPHIDNGRFKTSVVDWYDFNHRDKGNKLLNIPNNWGAEMQDKGKLENYSNVYYIDKEVPPWISDYWGLYNKVTPFINQWRNK